MELDGYNEDLALAFEYQGRQHYQFVSFFYDSMSDFERRLAIDRQKRELCPANGVTLIEVPFWVGYDQMVDYILEQCQEKNIKVPPLKEDTNFELIINRAFREEREPEQSRIDDFASDDTDSTET